MKYFLIGLAVWFAIAWLPQFVKGWINVIRFKIARKRANYRDKWIYEMWDKKGGKHHGKSRSKV